MRNLVSAHVRPMGTAGDTDVSYVQKGDTVTVYQGGDKVATLAVESPTADSHSTRALLRIKAHRGFSFSTGDFVWVDQHGADSSPLGPARVVHVRGWQTRTIELTYPQVGSGSVLWTPTTRTLAGAWAVSAGGRIVGLQQRAVSYVQRGDAVTVFHGGEQIAWIRLRSANRANRQSSDGQVVLTIKARRRFTFTAGDFVWEDEQGCDTAPLDADRVIHVYGRQARRVVLDYRDVRQGNIVWAPNLASSFRAA